MSAIGGLPATCAFMSQPKRQFQSTTTSFVKAPSSSLRSVKPISRSFGLRFHCSFRASTAVVYKVKLIGPERDKHEIEAPDDSYILDSAENAGLELLYSCRAGSCSTCMGKLESGMVDQSDGLFLNEDQMEQGYVLTCISYPKSDCVICTHKEEELHQTIDCITYLDYLFFMARS